MKLVFVSSTFRDMQFERDALNTRVVPRINQFLERYSETVHFGDLRWGVNTTELESEESSKKVLRVCLDQIDDCRPYMIVFVGERYGWIPSAELLHTAALLKGMDVSAIKENTSVTELEIEYGALLNPDFEGRVLFYFRNPFDMSKMTEEQRADYVSESPLHKEKVERLKEQIRKKYPNHIRYYDVTYDADSKKLVGLDALTDLIYEDLKRVFDLDLTYLNSLPTEERALANSKNHFEKLAQSSYLRPLSAVNEFDFEAFDSFCESRFENNPVLEVVCGPHGIGAKTLVAQKYKNTLDAGYNAVCFSFGMDEFTDSTEKMLSALCYRLEELMDIPHEKKATAERFARLCEEYTDCAELPYIYFYLINLPQGAIAIFRKLFALYPYLFGVGFCVHFRKPLSDESALPFFLNNRITHVPPLDPDEIGEMVSAILKSKRKELPPVVIDEIKKHSAADLPLYLSLLVERLLILDSEDFSAIRARGDGMDSINAYMQELIRKSGDTVTEIAKELLLELAERINPVMIPHLVAHIALPAHFTEDYIQEFFDYRGWSYSSLDYTLFKKTFPSLVYQDVSGYLRYTNDDVAAAARKLSEEWCTHRDMSAMMDFMDSKPVKEVIKAKMKLYREFGDAEGFAGCVLTHLDGARYTEDQTVALRCHRTFYDIMTDEICKDSDFALSVSKSIFDAVAKEDVKYPYDIAAYFLQCIPQSYVFEKDDLTHTYSFLERLEQHIEKLRDACDSEVLAFTHFLMCSSFMIPLLKKIGGTVAAQKAGRIADLIKKEGPDRPQRVLQIIGERKLPLVDVLRSSSTEMFRMFSDVLKMDDPKGHPMFHGLYKQCVKLEAYLTTKDSARYKSLLKGEIGQLPEKDLDVYALFLAMWGFCCYKKGKIKKANTCYNAFYTLFIKHFKDNPPDIKDRSMYIGAIKNYCRFLIAHEKKETARERFEELFSWCLSRMAETPTDFETAYELAQLHDIGFDNDCLEDKVQAFFPILGQILSESCETAVPPQTVLWVMKYYSLYSSILKDDERERYFLELASRITAGMAPILSEAEYGELEVIDLICDFCVDFALISDSDICRLIKEVITRTVDGHPDVFTKEKTEYIEKGLQIAIEILKERT